MRVAFAHAQFETIHPFLDGNGRIGRLLIAVLLEHWRVLPQPLRYLSLFLKQHRDKYCRLLSERRRGDFEAFVDFFFESVKQTADEATLTAQHLAGDCDRARSLAGLDLFTLMNTQRAQVLTTTQR